MGYVTIVQVLNDALGQITNNAQEFADGIALYQLNGGTLPVGNHANPVNVARSRHADQFQLVASWQGLMLVLSDYDAITAKLIDRRPALVQDFIASARRELDALEAAIMEREDAPFH